MVKISYGPKNYSLAFGPSGATSTGGGFGIMWPDWATPTKVTQQNNSYLFEFPTWTYKVDLIETQQGGVAFDVTVTNQSSTARPVQPFYLTDLGGLTEGMQSWWVGTDAQPGYMTFLMKDGSYLSFASESPGFACLLAMWQTANPFNGRCFFSVFTANDQAHLTQHTIVPGGQSITVRFSINHGTDPAVLVAPALDAWKATYPQKLNWPDRRPIGALFPAGGAVTPHNPQGWLSGIDTSDHANWPQFQQALLNLAKDSAAILKAAGAQGVVVWNLEGMKYPWTNYKGNPEIAEKTAPELVGVVDAFFQIFSDAGLLPGVCIRPWELGTLPDGSPFVVQQDNPLAALTKHIDYARTRWGCQLFYIDSYDRQDTETLRQLNTKFPTCLLMPEAWAPQQLNPAHLAYAAPYLEAGGGVFPADRTIYPNGFGVHLHWKDRLAIPAEKAKLLESIKAGDALFIAAHYDDGSQAAAADLIKQSGITVYNPPPTRPRGRR